MTVTVTNICSSPLSLAACREPAIADDEDDDDAELDAVRARPNGDESTGNVICFTAGLNVLLIADAMLSG